MVIFACHQVANKVVIMSYSKAVIAVTGILPNCSEIPNSCTSFQFFLFVYILDMFSRSAGFVIWRRRDLKPYYKQADCKSV